MINLRDLKFEYDQGFAFGAYVDLRISHDTEMSVQPSYQKIQSVIKIPDKIFLDLDLRVFIHMESHLPVAKVPAGIHLKQPLTLTSTNAFQVPLGLVLSYVVTTEPHVVFVDDRSGRMFFTKIAYTGRRDFDIGIETGLLSLPFLNVDDKPKVTMVSVTMSYFFN